MHVGGTELASSRCNTLNSEINHCLERHALTPPSPRGAGALGVGQASGRLAAVVGSSREHLLLGAGLGGDAGGRSLLALCPLPPPWALALGPGDQVLAVALEGPKGIVSSLSSLTFPSCVTGAEPVLLGGLEVIPLAQALHPGDSQRDIRELGCLSERQLLPGFPGAGGKGAPGADSTSSGGSWV